MAMEHAEDHVYGLQWHPEVCEPCRVHLTVLLCEDCLSSSFLEVINSKVGRKIVDRIFSLVGMLLTSSLHSIGRVVYAVRRHRCRQATHGPARHF